MLPGKKDYAPWEKGCYSLEGTMFPMNRDFARTEEGCMREVIVTARQELELFTFVDCVL